MGLMYLQVEMHQVYTVSCVWTNKIGNIVVTSGNLLCYVVFMDKFIFFSPAIKTSYLKSEDFSRKTIARSTSEFLDSTDRNYYEKLWAKLSSKKSPVVRVGQVRYIIICLLSPSPSPRDRQNYRMAASA